MSGLFSYVIGAWLVCRCQWSVMRGYCTVVNAMLRMVSLLLSITCQVWLCGVMRG